MFKRRALLAPKRLYISTVRGILLFEKDDFKLYCRKTSQKSTVQEV